MSSSRLLSSLMYLLSFSLLLKLALATNPTVYSCSGSGNFSANDAYNKNLNNLTSYLDSKTPLTGFSNGSVGPNNTRAYGLALCRGDINSTDCQACVDDASNEVQTICSFKKAAFVWYDYCQLKYSDIDFLGQIDETEWFYQMNSKNASDPTTFNDTVIKLFTNLEAEAYGSPSLYASGSLAYTKSTTLYGLVQCTRDLSSTDCKSCIDIAIRVFPYGKEGGKIMSGSCNVRMEIYPFVNP